MRGWLADRLDARSRAAGGRLSPPGRVRALFQCVEIVPLDEAAAARSTDLRKARVRIGTMDLKIASIALARGNLLLTANLRDFARVPGLRCENWVD